MKKYTLGIVFDQTLRNVLLMHKTKPDYQAGKLNALGGKIEEGETQAECVSREVLEESGLKIVPEAWIFIGHVQTKDWVMDVFTHAYSGPMSDAKSLEQERIEWIPVDQLPPNTIASLPWMILLAIEVLDGTLKQHFSLEMEWA